MGERRAQRLLVTDEGGLPLGRQKGPVARLRKALVHEEHCAPICLGADHAACSLQHTVHAGKHVSVVETGSALTLEVIFDVVSFGREPRKPDSDDRRSREPLPDEIDPFAEEPAHDGEPHERSLVGFRKAIEKCAPLVLVHRAVLDNELDLRCDRRERFVNGCHVLVGRKVQKIVSTLHAHEGRQKSGERFPRRVATSVGRRYALGDQNGKVLFGEG